MSVDVKWISSHIITNVIITCKSCSSSLPVYYLFTRIHGWLVFVRWYLTGWVWPNALLTLTEQINEKEGHHEGRVECVWSCACVCLWEPLRYQSIAHFSMTAQLCQHSSAVFLFNLIHIIMNDVMQWQKHYIYLNCSPTLLFSVYIICRSVL